MNKLLSAGFARLWKNMVFWIEIIVMMLFYAAVIHANYQSVKNHGASCSLDVLFPGSFMIIGFFAATFASMFLGTEYSDGTIRNKLVMGHSRVAIYLSNLIICFSSAILVCLSSIILICFMGIPMFGLMTRPLINNLALIGTGILVTAAYSAIFTLIAMLISNKPITAIACIFTCIALYFGSMMVSMKLEEPEFYTDYYTEHTKDISREPVSGLTYPNPNYLRGTKREIYEFIYDFLPAGQGFQLAQENPVPKTCFPLYSLFITISATAGGILVFRRKDLK